MNIFIVDNNHKFREAMRIYLDWALHHKIVGEADSGLNFLENYKYNNDIVLMDLNMSVLDGYCAIKNAFNRDTRIKAIAVTMFRDQTYLKKLIDMGFKGCVFKSEVFKKLPKVLDEVNKGNMYFPENINIIDE